MGWGAVINSARLLRYSARYSFLLTLLICCLLGNAIGWHRPAMATDLVEYRLASGDRITVVVFGQTDLSGDFTIDGGGYVQLPLIGAVPVAALTLQECEQRITARLGSGLIKRPVVSVRIGEFRPVYVLGDVRTPGVYPFRFGLRASAAISLAGGLATGQFGRLPDMAELLAATERVETLSAARNAALIRLSRIEAERANQKTVTPPKLENSRADDADIAALIRNEQAQLTTAWAAHEEAIKLLQLQRPRLQEQMESIKNEIKATQQQLEGTKSFLKQYAKLSEAGLGRGLTQFEFQRQEGQQQATIHRLRAEVSRLEVTVGDLDIRIKETERTRQARLMTELRESQTRLQELDVALASARKMLQLRRAQSGLATNTDNFTLDYDIRVTRFDSADQGRSIALAKDAPLDPGDVVEVHLKPLATLPGPAASGKPEQLPSVASANKRLD
jgi:polysaccharide export outer membrane protein